MNPFENFRLTSPFGMRMHPVDKVMRFHRGVDLVISPSNGNIKAFVAGEVLHAKMGATGSGFGNYGNLVAIRDDKGYLHVYAHLSSISVKGGQKIDKDQVVGKQGNTGKSSGAHLHYEVRKACSPSYGYTATEAGVVEPTKYLQDYYSKGELVKVDKKDANAIIDTYLKPAWGAAKTPADKQEIGRLADELRVASGQPKQNG
ncbi:M23 family metallopeptidase [Paenibacillus macquariensis]|uniref:Peptidase family M23 n=1 Tax=Paenibacillus macquariensis TaxID=948756 RepID=A0ABY1KE85_9BACL|nr:M23 family metallopeptidase [Paenibacillus macquariensis]MEC0093428.1 M23 family metallopeptidase [Paenibacillus macquariensis]OAB38919.1 hypothetical protein PMSM_01140 [Paenibacillus macquariensis subsp. macquariensis]SIR69841.1 Peptidase family M23 [Paenibacillus macquariensis]